jgi:hypothetical protein
MASYARNKNSLIVLLADISDLVISVKIRDTAHCSTRNRILKSSVYSNPVDINMTGNTKES